MHPLVARVDLTPIWFVLVVHLCALISFVHSVLVPVTMTTIHPTQCEYTNSSVPSPYPTASRYGAITLHTQALSSLHTSSLLGFLCLVLIY